MGKISVQRVILGGLLAGVLINISEFIANTVVFMEEWSAAMKALGKSADLSAGAMTLFVIYGFLVGIGIVWLYAAIRPRFGPGPKTALVAGLAYWILAQLLPTIAFLPMDLFPAGLMAKGAAWTLVEALVAAQLGAWLYREA